MAHLVENMAFVGDTPWHGLGNQLPANQPIEVWQREAGMDWEILESEVLYRADYKILPYADSKVLHRSDTGKALSVVSKRYQVVQPGKVLGFYRDLVSVGGFELESAGVLKEGKKLWALAKTGQETLLKGGDQVKAYLLLATSCDGTLATTAQFTSVRVVCNNTLTFALNSGSEKGRVARIVHSEAVTGEKINAKLGVKVPLAQQFDDQMALLRALAATEVRDADLARASVALFHRGERDADAFRKTISMKGVKESAAMAIQRAQIGAELAGMDHTPYGWLNAVTQQADHMTAARTEDRRMERALFGNGERHKERAVKIARQMADGTFTYELEGISDKELLDLILA